MSDVRYTRETYLASDCIRENDVRGVVLRESIPGVRPIWRRRFLGKIFFENGQFGGVIFGEKFFEKYFVRF